LGILPRACLHRLAFAAAVLLAGGFFLGVNLRLNVTVNRSRLFGGLGKSFEVGGRGHAFSLVPSTFSPGAGDGTVMVTPRPSRMELEAAAATASKAASLLADSPPTSAS